MWSRTFHKSKGVIRQCFVFVHNSPYEIRFTRDTIREKISISSNIQSFAMRHHIQIKKNTSNVRLDNRQVEWVMTKLHINNLHKICIWIPLVAEIGQPKSHLFHSTMRVKHIDGKRRQNSHRRSQLFSFIFIDVA